MVENKEAPEPAQRPPEEQPEKNYVVGGKLLQAVLNALATLPYKDSVLLINEIVKLNEQHPDAAPEAKNEQPS